MTPRRLQVGFKLVELLVVLVIITVLAGLLFPILASARRSAYGATCLSNVDQISKALLLYANSADDQIPKGAGPSPGYAYWMDQIGLRHARGDDYLTARPVLVCPVFKPSRDLEGYHGGYATNRCMDSISQPTEPGTTVLVGEGGVYAITGDDVPMPMTLLSAPDEIQFEVLPKALHENINTSPIGQWAATRHGGRSNYAFCDGHAASLKPEQFSFPLTADACNRAGDHVLWSGPRAGFVYALTK